MQDQNASSYRDVFLSYKREERELAEQLARYLVTRGYDVWWDAAILAGEDFEKVVHAEISRSRTVIVLWSNQAIFSKWVRAEATLALQHGTLVNAIIDDMAFEGIPPEFSHLHAVRLEEDFNRFCIHIAEAIARKGVGPSQTSSTTAQAIRTLEDKVRDADFYRIIANSTQVGDYEEYLQKFGDSGQFSGPAKRRLAVLLAQEAERRGLWSRLRANGRLLSALLASGAAVVAILAYLGIDTSSKREVEVTAETSDPVDAASLGLPERSPSFEFYPNVDFPYGDYSNGMTDGRLNGLSATQCLEHCAAEKACKVFVYNEKARVCFLKTTWDEPMPFNGAFSAVKLPPR